MLVAVEHEARGFFGGFGINDASEFHVRFAGVGLGVADVSFLVGDDANGPPADARVTAKNRRAIFSAIFIPAAAVHDARDDFVHVILFAGVRRKNAIDFTGRVERRFGRFVVEWRIAGMADLIYKRADTVEAGFVIRFAEIHGAADLRV